MLGLLARMVVAGAAAELGWDLAKWTKERIKTLLSEANVKAKCGKCTGMNYTWFVAGGDGKAPRAGLRCTGCGTEYIKLGNETDESKLPAN